MALYLGLMSGTSMDGVDAALIDSSNHQLLAGITRPYSREAYGQLEHVLRSESVGLGTLSQLSTLLGREFALTALELLQTTNHSPKEIAAIGSHGQTLCHDAMADIPYTVQLGCPHTIAQLTGIRVVADFRTRDLVVGGQGAPFAPLYHRILFSGSALPVAVVNIGGIANVSVLDGLKHVLGFDVGPGNCLMDAWTRGHLFKSFDMNGDWAASGQVIQPLFAELLSDPFFKRRTPKSVGKEYFSLHWLKSKLKTEYLPEDVQATLLELTAKTIRDAITSPVSAIIICGGGVHNTALLRVLQTYFDDCRVVSSADFGVDPDYIEAMMFAWLAEQTLHNRPIDLTALTGAKSPVILGAIYPVV